MEFLNRSRLPNFTPRADLTAEDLNHQADVLVAAINEIAGRVYIIKDRIAMENREQYSEELDYPILDELDRLARELTRAFNDITTNRRFTEENIRRIDGMYADLEKRLNALDDRAALKKDLAALIQRVDWISAHNLPTVGPDNYWYVGDINTGVPATGNSGVYMGEVEPTDPAIGIWIDTSDGKVVALAEKEEF